MAYDNDDHTQTIGVHWHNNDIILCLLGGIALGTISASRMYIFGKVTGISGLLQGAVVVEKKYVQEHGYFDRRRLTSLMFITGLIVSSVMIIFRHCLK